MKLFFFPLHLFDMMNVQLLLDVRLLSKILLRNKHCLKPEDWIIYEISFC